MRISDWSSDVCSSDLGYRDILLPPQEHERQGPASKLDRSSTLASQRALDRHLPVHDRQQGNCRQRAARAQAPRTGHCDGHVDPDEDRSRPDPYAFRSEEHKSEFQSLMSISSAVFDLSKTKS